MENNKIATMYDLLLKRNHFICKRVSPRGTERYCIYSDTMQPLVIISKSEMNSVSHILTEKDKKWSLSRRYIRALHGNDILKKIYLQKIKKDGKEEVKSE